MRSRRKGQEKEKDNAECGFMIPDSSGLCYIYHRDGKSGGRGGRRPCYFFYRCANSCFFSRVFQSYLPFLCNFWHFCSLLNSFEHFSHIFCVLIFQAPSSTRAIYMLFPSLMGEYQVVSLSPTFMPVTAGSEVSHLADTPTKAALVPENIPGYKQLCTHEAVCFVITISIIIISCCKLDRLASLTIPAWLPLTCPCWCGRTLACSCPTEPSKANFGKK